MARPTARLLGALCVALFLTACGGGAVVDPGTPGVPNPPPQPPPPPPPPPPGPAAGNVDLFVGDQAQLHVYRDALNLAASGAVPDVALLTPNMRDFDVDGGRLFVASDATATTVTVDIFRDQAALTAASTPDVTLTIPAPMFFNSIVVKSVDVHGDVMCVLTESTVPDLVFDLAYADVHVFTDLDNLTNVSAPTAVVPLVGGEPLSTFIGELVLSDEVLCVQGSVATSSVWVYRSPATLTNASTPDAQLDMTSTVQVPQGLRLEGSTFYCWSTNGGGRLLAFRNIVTATTGQAPDVSLFGASLVGGGLLVACAEAGNRLFVSSDITTNGVGLVGFDDPGSLFDSAPPTVQMSTVPANPYAMDAAAGSLWLIDVATGTVHGYRDANAVMTDGAAGTTITSAAMPAPALIRAVERPAP